MPSNHSIVSVMVTSARFGMFLILAHQRPRTAHVLVIFPVKHCGLLVSNFCLSFNDIDVSSNRRQASALVHCWVLPYGVDYCVTPLRVLARHFQRLYNGPLLYECMIQVKDGIYTITRWRHASFLSSPLVRLFQTTASYDKYRPGSVSSMYPYIAATYFHTWGFYHQQP